jgi:two-component system sensor histidine kinase CpxA
MKIRVRSIFTKIVVWAVATVLLSLVGFIVTSVFVSARLSGRNANWPRLSGMFLDDARRAFQQGGPERLDAYLRRLKDHTDAEHFLTDGRGIDLVTGEDRSALRPSLPSPYRSALGRYLPRTESAVRIRRSRDGQFRLITVTPPPRHLDPWESFSQFLWLPILIAVLCYLLAVHLASPLRNLRKVVERFGRGELGARSELNRKDEIGELADSFNRMAGQISTLLTAERRLLQDVSHELRSPLARLGFAVELAKTSPDRETALARIRQEAARLTQLVDEVLQLTRAEGDPTARILESVDCGELLAEVVDSCTLDAEMHGCRLESKIDATPVVSGDFELLQRACDNVLRNAIRHAPKGTSVTVELSKQNGHARIAVRDYGAGVPPDALSEIFKPFFRVETDRGRSSGGVGLGLAIASRAVEIHQGRITARNANPGLLVEIELPIGE